MQICSCILSLYESIYKPPIALLHNRNQLLGFEQFLFCIIATKTPFHISKTSSLQVKMQSAYYEHLLHTVHSHEPSPPFCVTSTVDNIHTCTLEQIMSSPLHAYLEDNPFAAWFTYYTACRYFQGRKQNATYINATVKVVNLSSFHFLIFNRLTQFTYTAHYI